MTIPYQDVFLVLLVGYCGYSLWAGLSPRYPLFAALLLLLAAAGTNWAGATEASNNLGLDAIFVLAAAVGLTSLEIVRARGLRPRAAGVADPPAADTPQPGQPSSQHSLDDLQGEAVATVDASRSEDDHDEHSGDGEPDQGE